MTRRWRISAKILLTLAALLAGGRTVAAHPHVWVDLRTSLVLDEEGRLAAVEQEWLFDPIYSAYAVGGVEAETEEGRAALAGLIADSMTNLHDYDYFMRVRADGERVSFAAATDYSADLREGRLVYRFTVPLAEPADPVARDLDVAVFDPTYYIEMVHLEGDVVTLRGANPAGCGARIVAPTPDMETVVMAQSLDKNAMPDNTLGAQFAELVVIQCR